MKRHQKNKDLYGSMDIAAALRGWEFQSGQINVRLIRGGDGKPKIQLRLDLGLLQMEISGRPDGKRPHRSATELDFQRNKLSRFVKKSGTDAGFKLSSRDCQALREESAMFYHRYLSLFVLEQYQAVLRDTQHNLDALDLCHRYGATDFDRGCLEQYRPYILMMHARARACEALRSGYIQTALAYLHGGIRQIGRLIPRPARKTELRRSNEAKILFEMIAQIREQLPPDPRDVVTKQLKAAVAAERYEDAARLRDQLLALMAEPLIGSPSRKASAENAEVPAPAGRRSRRSPSKKPPSAGEE